MTAFPKAKPKRKNPRRTLIRKLDAVFSQYVRERDRWTCCTCGRQARTPQTHAGHYVSRRVLALRWDERNVHAQCAGCNTYKAGAGPQYAAFLLRTYGAQELERLDADSRRTWKPTLEELRNLLGHFQGRLSGLQDMPLGTHQSHGDEKRAKVRAAGHPAVAAPVSVGFPQEDR